MNEMRKKVVNFLTFKFIFSNGKERFFSFETINFANKRAL